MDTDPLTAAKLLYTITDFSNELFILFIDVANHDCMIGRRSTDFRTLFLHLINYNIRWVSIQLRNWSISIGIYYSLLRYSVESVARIPCFVHGKLVRARTNFLSTASDCWRRLDRWAWPAGYTGVKKCQMDFNYFWVITTKIMKKSGDLNIIIL